jgi:hypothetical protein
VQSWAQAEEERVLGCAGVRWEICIIEANDELLSLEPEAVVQELRSMSVTLLVYVLFRQEFTMAELLADTCRVMCRPGFK